MTSKLYILYILIALTISYTLTSCSSDGSNHSLKAQSAIAGALNSDSSIVDTNKVVTQDTPKVETITIVGVGDIMMGTNYPSKRHLPPHDGKKIFDGVLAHLSNADLTFGNLEGVIGDGGRAKSCNDPKYCYTFRMPGHYTNHLTNAGFDVVSIANNHANDFGSGGRKASAAVLDTSGLAYAGSISKPYTTFELGGVTYGFLAAAPNSGCFNMKEYSKAAEYVAMLDSICDIVIVSFHAGAEGTKHRHTPRRDETFLGYNRGNVYKFAHKCIDAGADILFGHGPHVTRAVELYKDRFITYSMGNFCTYDKFSLKGSKGVGPIVKLEVDKEGKFLSGELVATKQIDRGIPVLDTTNKVINEVIELTKADFPESPLEITEDGKILRK
ncbi:MAG: CapA family protein [Aureispira sp.]|nr:CapA family protein [Aureispira sp.]